MGCAQSLIVHLRERSGATVLKQCKRVFRGKKPITMLRLLYDHNCGAFLGFIELWTYFDRAYPAYPEPGGGPQRKWSDDDRDRLAAAYYEAEAGRPSDFLELLAALPDDLVNYGIGNFTEGFWRCGSDDIPLTPREIEALEAELRRLHKAIASREISLYATL